MPLEIVEGKTFTTGQTVTVDGKYFTKCTFDGCTLRYGGENFSMDGCDIVNTPIEVFGQAKNTIRFLQIIRSFSPGFAFDLLGPDDPEGPLQ